MTKRRTDSFKFLLPDKSNAVRVDKDDSVLSFHFSDSCLSPSQNDTFDDILEAHLRELSQGRTIFADAERLICINDIFAQQTVLEYYRPLKSLLSYLNLSEAIVKSRALAELDSLAIYFFSGKCNMSWNGFLASCQKFASRKPLLHDGIIEACFISADMGCNYYFEYNISMESQFQQFITDLEDLGMEITCKQGFLK